MLVQSFPIHENLVPELERSVPEGFNLLESTLVQGLPHRIVIAGEADVVLVVPTGEANRWRQADPRATLSTGAAQQISIESLPSSAGLALDRVPARLLVRRASKVVAVLPLTAGLQQRIVLLPGDSGELLDLRILDWDLRAGHLRGSGDYGGFIHLAWKRSEKALTHYSTPPINPYLLPRLKPVNRMISRLGLKRPLALRRFSAKQRHMMMTVLT